MTDKLSRYWRICGTAISFSLFGIGGLVLRGCVFPLLHVLIRHPQRRTQVARDVIRLTFRSFVGIMCSLGVLRYEIRGRERLERPGLLILANHPTLIDTVFLLAFVRNADCIVKSSLWNNPFTYGPLRAAGYISNSSGPEMVEDAIASLREGSNLIIFPEGTRTPADGAITLRRGAANIAIRGMRGVTPVVIRCTPRTLGKNEKWWQVPSRRAHLTLEVNEDIDVGPFIERAGSDVLAARHLTDHLQSYFTREATRHAVA